MNDVVVGRGAVYEEKVLVPESAALEALRVVDLLIQSDDRRQVVKLEVGKGRSVRYSKSKKSNLFILKQNIPELFSYFYSVPHPLVCDVLLNICWEIPPAGGPILYLHTVQVGPVNSQRKT